MKSGTIVLHDGNGLVVELLTFIGHTLSEKVHLHRALQPTFSQKKASMKFVVMGCHMLKEA